jgi:2-polyprenyl-3-methyl-5-hydroxy-6-metoxy-1,4-benzoquinol methylase
MSTPSTNINDTFFEGLYQYAWKHTIPEGLTEAEVDFIIEIGKLKAGESILDLMCGYGRHAIELGRRGINVTAIDNLYSYIIEIKDKALQQSLPVKAIQENILDAKFEKVYDSAICMGNSFAFFQKHDALTILSNISSHLKKGGILIINSWMIAEITMKYFREKEWHQAGNYKCILDYKFLFNPTRIESEQTFLSDDGEVEMKKGIDYIYSLNEYEEMFQQAGFKTLNLYSTPRKRKFTFGDVRVYIVAEKL